MQSTTSRQGLPDQVCLPVGQLAAPADQSPQLCSILQSCLVLLTRQALTQGPARQHVVTATECLMPLGSAHSTACWEGDPAGLSLERFLAAKCLPS